MSTLLRAGEWSGMRNLPAGDVAPGMFVWLAAKGQVEADRVVGVALAPARGLFNPYTLGGTIVVDGVLASAHSSSFLDGLFAGLGLDIPTAYQVISDWPRPIYAFS